MLYHAVSNCDLDVCLKSKDEYRPFPAYGDRAAWTGLPGEIKDYYLATAESLIARSQTCGENAGQGGSSGENAGQGGSSGVETARTAFTPLIPALNATLYIEFMRDGNRSRYESAYFTRRSNLVALLLAECVRGDGALLDYIIDIIWAICEESSWVIPAHNNQSGTAPRSLPDVEAPIYIDLFSAETGSALSWVYYFLGDAIGAKAPLVKRRIELEITRRILDPYLYDDSFGWKGLANGDPVNNWNPWINSNVLVAWLVIEPDAARRKEGVLRAARSTQCFLDFYYPDGGCDEGPSYFNVAGASLFDWLEEIGYATGGAVNIYHEPLIANIAKYIYRAHIGANRFVNFADAPSRVSVATGLLSRVGRAIGDDTLVNFSAYMARGGFAQKEYVNGHNTLHRLMKNIFGYAADGGGIEGVGDGGKEYVGSETEGGEEGGTEGAESGTEGAGDETLSRTEGAGDETLSRTEGGVENAEVDADDGGKISGGGVEDGAKISGGRVKDMQYAAPRDHFFEGIQVMTARNASGGGDGIFVAMKGGNNAESHNHNDVGNFILYAGNEPVIIDAGVETYTKETFGPERYSIWTMTSGYHNVPEINGREQSPGTEFGAGGVTYEDAGDYKKLTMDIAGAYPKEAEIIKYQREFIFGGGALIITDSFSLREATEPVKMNLLCLDAPETGDGKILFGKSAAMSFDKNYFTAGIEKIELKDKTIRGDWERGALYRVTLTAKKTEISGSYRLTFHSSSNAPV